MRRELVILSRSLPHHGLGGMEIVTWDLAVELVRLGHAVRVITTSLPDRDGEFFQDGVCVVPLANTPTRRYSHAWWRESRKYFETHCMNTTQGVLSVSAAGYGLLPLKRLMPNVPFILQAHGTSWGEVVSKWRSRRFRSIVTSIRNLVWLPRDLTKYRKFDTVLAVGERVRLDLIRPPVKWVLPKQRVRLINNGIDTSLFCPCREGRTKIRERLGISEFTSVVISASRLHNQKGVAHGLRAFRLLLKSLPDAVYLIAGDGPERPRLEALTTKLTITKKVCFLGTLSRADLAEVLQAGDIFLFLTERVEGLPLNVLEALASGVPCVVSEHLTLFRSTFIHKAPPSDTTAIIKLLLGILTMEKVERNNLLPEEFHLRYSAQHYSNLYPKRE